MSVRGIFAPFPIDPADNPSQFAGAFYPVSPSVATGPNPISTASRYFCLPWMADVMGPVTSIGVSITAGGSTVSTMKVALVGAIPTVSGWQPAGTAIGSNNAGVSTTGTGVVNATLTAPAPIVRGTLYFVVAVFTWDVAAPTVVTQQNTTTLHAIMLGTGLGTAPSTFCKGWVFDGTYTNDISAAGFFTGQSYTAIAGADTLCLQVGV